MTRPVAAEIARVQEVTDAAGDSTTAFTILAGDRFVGTLEADDVDWIAVEFVEGEVYRFSVDGRGAGALADPRLALMAADGTEINADDDSGEGAGAMFVWTARQTETLFLAVDGTGTGNYRLITENLTAEDTPEGGAGDDRIAGDGLIAGMGGDDVLFGGDGEDTVRGGRGADNLRSGKGGDTLTAGRGDDRLAGNEGRDELFGGAGDDIAYGGRHSDRINGQDNADRLLGGDGDDVMTGGNGIDRVFGGAGDDTVRGGSGYDFLRGGEGADTFEFRATGGQDVIGDFTTGEDTLVLRAGLFEDVVLNIADALDAVGEIVDGDSVLTFFTGAVLILRGVDYTDIVDDVVIG